MEQQRSEVENKIEVEKKNPSTPPRGGARRPKTSNRYGRDFKLRAVKLFIEEGFTRNAICAELHISVATLDRWVTQYRHLGAQGLEDQPTGPRPAAPKIPAAVTDKILQLKQSNPSFGAKRISQWLRRLFFLQASPETVRQRLHEAALMDPAPAAKRRNLTRPRFFERATPNQMWQSDIFTFRLGGRYAYLIAFLDDYSRLVTGADLFRSPTAHAVIEVYRQAVGEFQPPKEMLTDNGRQYTTWRGTSRFEAELKKDRVAHIKSRPQHPMTLGKIERFWETLWQEFLARAQFESFEAARERIKLWIRYYNHKRPHQGIEGLGPADRFFEIQSQLRKTIEAGIQENLLEMALRGQPRAPFYMVGRMEGQSVVLRAEKGKLKLEVSDDAKAQTTRELTYELNQSQSNPATAPQGDTAQTPPLHPLQLQCPGESPGGAGRLDRAGQPGRHLPADEHQFDHPPAVAAASHASPAPGPGEPGQPGQGRLESSAPGAVGEISAARRPDQVPQSPGIQPAKQDCQSTAGSGKSNALNEPLSSGAQSASTCSTHFESPLRATDRHGGGAEAGHLPASLLPVGATGAASDAPGPGGAASGTSAPPARPTGGSTPATEPTTPEAAPPL